MGFFFSLTTLASFSSKVFHHQTFPTFSKPSPLWTFTRTLQFNPLRGVVNDAKSHSHDFSLIVLAAICLKKNLRSKAPTARKQIIQHPFPSRRWNKSKKKKHFFIFFLIHEYFLLFSNRIKFCRIVACNKNANSVRAVGKLLMGSDWFRDKKKFSLKWSHWKR